MHLVGMCGTDLTNFRGGNAMVTFPPRARPRGRRHRRPRRHPPTRNPRHLSPYTHCGVCPSCRRGGVNACQHNQTMGVQRDGAMTEYISVPANRLFPANLSLKQPALVEPLTVGAHAACRGRILAQDTFAVFGCGGIGLGAIANSAFRGARTVAIDVDHQKLEVARRAGPSSSSTPPAKISISPSPPAQAPTSSSKPSACPSPSVPP